MGISVLIDSLLFHNENHLLTHDPFHHSFSVNFTHNMISLAKSVFSLRSMLYNKLSV